MSATWLQFPGSCLLPPTDIYNAIQKKKKRKKERKKPEQPVLPKTFSEAYLVKEGPVDIFVIFVTLGDSTEDDGGWATAGI